MRTKICNNPECGKELPVSEFYRHGGMADGYLNKCKKCTRKRVKKHRNVNVDRIRQYDRERGNRQDMEYVRDYRARFPKKYKATNAVNNAIRDGKMKKGKKCEMCSSSDSIVGHHDDYNKPLSVRWLCQSCHKQWHAENGEGANAS